MRVVRCYVLRWWKSAPNRRVRYQRAPRDARLAARRQLGDRHMHHLALLGRHPFEPTQRGFHARDLIPRQARQARRIAGTVQTVLSLLDRRHPRRGAHLPPQPHGSRAQPTALTIRQAAEEAIGLHQTLLHSAEGHEFGRIFDAPKSGRMVGRIGLISFRHLDHPWECGSEIMGSFVCAPVCALRGRAGFWLPSSRTLPIARKS